MAGFQCKHSGCGARWPRRVNFCPLCGASQVEPAPAPPPRQAAAPPQRPKAVTASPPRQTVTVSSAKAREPRGGIGFWIVALALMFSVWLTFSDDKKPPPDEKLRHNAGQVKRK
jgi:hypothetical protein